MSWVAARVPFDRIFAGVTRESPFFASGLNRDATDRLGKASAPRSSVCSSQLGPLWRAKVVNICTALALGENRILFIAIASSH